MRSTSIRSHGGNSFTSPAAPIDLAAASDRSRSHSTTAAATSHRQTPPGSSRVESCSAMSRSISTATSISPRSQATFAANMRQKATIGCSRCSAKMSCAADSDAAAPSRSWPNQWTAPSPRCPHASLRRFPSARASARVRARGTRHAPPVASKKRSHRSRRSTTGLASLYHERSARQRKDYPWA